MISIHDFLYLLITIGENVLTGYNLVLIYRFIYSNTKSKKHIIIVGLYAVILALIRQATLYVDFPGAVVLSRILMYVTIIILCYKFFKVKLWQAVILFLLLVFTVVIGELFIDAIVTQAGIDIAEVMYGKDLVMYLVVNMAIYLLEMLTLMMASLIKGVRSLGGSVKNKTYIFIALNIVLTLIIMTMTEFTIVYNSSAVVLILTYGIICVAMLICNVLSIGMVLQVDFREERLKMQESYNEVLKEFRHKFLGIVSILTALSEDNNTDDLKEYITELNKGFVGRVKGVPVNIENSKLFYLLSIKIGEAYDKSVSVKTIVPFKIENIEGINEDDFIYVINELMSNAIEHAGDSVQKEVAVRIENLPDHIKVTVENSIDESVSENKYSIFTGETKKDGRGYGLKQVQKLIGGNAYFKVGITDRFTVELVINK